MNEVSSTHMGHLQLAIGSQFDRQAKVLWTKTSQSDEVDWRELASIAVPGGLGPLLYSSLGSVDLSRIPLPVLKVLKDSYFETASLNTLALHNLKLILQLFSQCEIDVIPLKGSALLLSVYDNLALRPMVDIDLLIRYEDLDRALVELKKLGYSASYLFPIKDPSGLFWNQIMLQSNKVGALTIELHWNLIDIPYYAQRLTAEELLERAVTSEHNQLTSLILSPEDQVLHLSMHNFFHHFGQFQRAAVDLSFLAQRFCSVINWKSIIETAESIDIIMALTMTVTDAAENWYAPIPDTIVKELKKARPGNIENLFRYSQRNEYLKLLRTFLTVPGAKLKGQFILGQMFPNKEFMTWRYGTSASSSRFLAHSKRYYSGLASFVSHLTNRN